MPKFLIKAARDRDAYIEWSTVSDDAVSVGNRADYAADPAVYPEERLNRTDKNGTSALHWADRPGPEQPGGWDDDGLIVDQRGLLPRAQFETAFDHLNTTGEPIPDSMLTQFDDDEEETMWTTNYGADGIPCTEYPPEVLAALTVILLERAGGSISITPEESDRVSRMLNRPQREHARLAVYRQTICPYRLLHAGLLPAVQVIEGTVSDNPTGAASALPTGEAASPTSHGRR